MSRPFSTLLIWSCVAASVVYWSLRLLAEPQPVPQSARLASAAPAQSVDWSRLLGAAPKPSELAAAPPPAAASRFRLVGVAAAGAGPGPAVEVALIAIDGKPPRAFRVGQLVADDYLLAGVTRQGATLATAASAQAAPIVLDMPLPTASAGGAAVPVVTPLPAAAPVVNSAPAQGAVATEVPPQTLDMRNGPLGR